MNHNPQKIPRVSPYEIWYKQGLFRTAHYENGRPFPNFKTGALNRSASVNPER